MGGSTRYLAKVFKFYPFYIIISYETNFKFEDYLTLDSWKECLVVTMNTHERLIKGCNETIKSNLIKGCSNETIKSNEIKGCNNETIKSNDTLLH